jgi:hypothetical protein
MKTILFLFALLMAVKVLAWLGRKFSRASAPPLRIRLIPVPASSHGDFARTQRKELEMLGFRAIGVFQVAEIKGLELAAFSNPSHAVCAVVYRHPVAKVFVDMVSMIDDDASLTVTTAPKGGNLDQRPGHRKIYAASLPIPNMLERLLAERSQGSHRVLDESNFKQLFERQYEREMAWRLGRGGVTMDEVRREAAAMGIDSSKVVAAATQKLQKAYAKEYAESARRDPR